MKKKIVLSVLIVTIFALTMIYLMHDKENIVYSSEVHTISKEDTLAIMYETEADSGEYTVSDDTSWPTEGYIFNAELSRCENGSTLYWDDETKSVMMEANVSDKCYVYFDIESYKLHISIIEGLRENSSIVRLNNVDIDSLNEVEYNIGDILHFFPLYSGASGKIYDESGSLIYETNFNGCEWLEYKLTGIEYKLEIYESNESIPDLYQCRPTVVPASP